MKDKLDKILETEALKITVGIIIIIILIIII